VCPLALLPLSRLTRLLLPLITQRRGPETCAVRVALAVEQDGWATGWSVMLVQQHVSVALELVAVAVACC